MELLTPVRIEFSSTGPTEVSVTISAVSKDEKLYGLTFSTKSNYTETIQKAFNKLKAVDSKDFTLEVDNGTDGNSSN